LRPLLLEEIRIMYNQDLNIMSNFTSIVKHYINAVAICDFQKLKLLMHEEYTFKGPDGSLHSGPDMRFDSAVITFNAFPDLSYEYIRCYLDGNIVICELVMNGTQQGEYMGHSPSNKQIAVPVCSIIEIKDGLIFSEHEYFDRSYLIEQIGNEVDMKAKLIC